MNGPHTAEQDKSKLSLVRLEQTRFLMDTLTWQVIMIAICSGLPRLKRFKRGMIGVWVWETVYH